MQLAKHLFASHERTRSLLISSDLHFRFHVCAFPSSQKSRMKRSWRRCSTLAVSGSRNATKFLARCPTPRILRGRSLLPSWLFWQKCFVSSSGVNYNYAHNAKASRRLWFFWHFLANAVKIAWDRQPDHYQRWVEFTWKSSWFNSFSCRSSVCSSFSPVLDEIWKSICPSSLNIFCRVFATPSSTLQLHNQPSGVLSCNWLSFKHPNGSSHATQFSTTTHRRNKLFHELTWAWKESRADFHGRSNNFNNSS